MKEKLWRNSSLKEKEDLKSKLESRIQREMAKRAAEDKVNRAVSPITYVSISLKCRFWVPY